MTDRKSFDGTQDKEDNMNLKEQETKPGKLTRREFLKASVAAIAGTAAGLVLPDALTNKARADAPVPAPQPDAPVEPVYTNKAFVPFVSRDAQRPETKDNTPLYLREFGAPERGVIMRNKVEQGGGNPAYVEMGDQELFNNMLYLRETYGRPDLKLEITFYSSLGLMQRSPEAPPYDYPNTTDLIPYGTWVNIFKANGERRFRFRVDTKTLEFHISLPEPRQPGRIPTKEEFELIHLDFIGNYFVTSIVLANESGRSNLSFPVSRSIMEDLNTHRAIFFENGQLAKSAFWINMEIVPTKGGK